MQRNAFPFPLMGTCMSSCKGSVPNSKGNASLSKGTAAEANSPSRVGTPSKITGPKDQVELSGCRKDQPYAPSVSIDLEPPEVQRNASAPREDKRVIVHETVREADAGASSDHGSIHKDASPADDLFSPLKENQDVNPVKSVKSDRKFTGKATNGTGPARHSNCRQVPVKRQSRGANHTKSRPAQKRTPSGEPGAEITGAEKKPSALRRTASSPSRRIELQTCRISESGVESKPVSSKKISAEKSKSGDSDPRNTALRSRPPAFGASKNSTGGIGKCGYSEGFSRKARSCRMQLNGEVVDAQISEVTRQCTGENSISEEQITVKKDDEDNPENCREGSPSEMQSDSTVPPIDLENPLISLDCFIFL